MSLSFPITGTLPGNVKRFVSVKKFHTAFPNLKLKPFEEAVENYIDDFRVTK